ncbi:type IV secretory system Conjugative DNA transfer [Sesbania bispinosa]|nr:type IV secretory system Conjugative DNA transfer [Sesbania bispinosa]
MAEQGGGAGPSSTAKNGNHVLNGNFVTNNYEVNAGESPHGESLTVSRRRRQNNNFRKNGQQSSNQKKESISKNAFNVLANHNDRETSFPKQGNTKQSSIPQSLGLTRKKRARVSPPIVVLSNGGNCSAIAELRSSFMANRHTAWLQWRICDGGAIAAAMTMAAWRKLR